MTRARDDQEERRPAAAKPIRSRPPAIDVEAIAKDARAGPPSGRPSSYVSPSRGILDAIGAPRGIQRLSAAIVPTGTSPRTHGESDVRQIHTVDDIGSRVRERRNAMGMTQQRFADLAGVGRRFLIELENGKPGLEIGRVLKVCKAAGVRLGFLP